MKNALGWSHMDWCAVADTATDLECHGTVLRFAEIILHKKRFIKEVPTGTLTDRLLTGSNHNWTHNAIRKT